MEGRFSKGLLYVLANCKDPAKEEELNQWFNQTHFPDMTTSGIFTAALRFRNVSPSLDPHEARYATLYETEHDDLAEVMQKLDALIGDLHQRGRIHPAVEMVHVALYRGMDSGFQTRATGQKTRGIMVMESDCSDPSREEEFNRWYDDIHLPDVLSTGLYHAAYRYEAFNPPPGTAKHIAVYETDSRDPGAVDQEVVTKFKPQWQKSGHYIDTLQPKRRGVYERVFPPA